MTNTYFCKKCAFASNNKYNYNKHITTKKHMKKSLSINEDTIFKKEDGHPKKEDGHHKKEAGHLKKKRCNLWFG